MKTTVAAIDFGTSKIVTLVAENSGSQRCDIVAAGVAKYDGYLTEGWNNPGQLDEAIRRSISDAEEQAQSKIREIYVGVPGAFTRVYATQVTITLKGTDPRVTSEPGQHARRCGPFQPGVVYGGQRKENPGACRHEGTRDDRVHQLRGRQPVLRR